VTKLEQACAGRVHEVGADIDRDHNGLVARLTAGVLAKQGGVVAGPGADLQDPVAGLDIEGVEHAQHQGGFGGRGHTTCRPCSSGSKAVTRGTSAYTESSQVGSSLSMLVHCRRCSGDRTGARTGASGCS